MIKNKVIVCTVIVSILCSSNVVSAKHENITLKTKSVNTTVGATKTIKFTKKKGVKITFKKFISTNKKVASVSKKGKVTAKSTGKCTIKVNVKYEYRKKNKKVNFRVPVKVTEKNIVTPSPVDEQSSNTVTPNSTKVPSSNKVNDSGTVVTPSSTPSVINITEEQKQKYSENDINILSSIISEQVKLDANTDTDIFNSDNYKWGTTDENGKYRLNSITFKTDFLHSVKGFLDFSGLTELRELNLKYNSGIIGINISNNLNLQKLDISSTNISELDVSNNTKLKKLDIGYTDITELNISNNKELKELSCGLSNCKLSSLDISKNTDLEKLVIPYDFNINLSNNTKIKDLTCGVDTDISYLNDLETLHLYDMKDDYKHTIEENNVVDIDLSKFSNLSILGLNYCNIGSLKVSDTLSINNLWLSDCRLQSDDIFKTISGLNNLEDLSFVDVSGIPTELDLSNFNKLLSFDLGFCSIVKSVDLTGNADLESLNIFDNELLEKVNLGQKDKLGLIICGSNKNLKELDITGVTRDDCSIEQDYGDTTKIIR